MLREQKFVVLTKEFWYKAMKRRIFASAEEAKDLTTRAVKREGIMMPEVLVPDGALDKYRCIFTSPNKKYITAPVIEYRKDFIVATVFFSTFSDIRFYKQKKKFKGTL